MTDVGRDIHADEFAPEVVARSKDVVATAAEELEDYQSWLKDFVASEEKSRKRHASALKREQVRYRRQLKRERTVRAVKRTALTFCAFRSLHGEVAVAGPRCDDHVGARRDSGRCPVGRLHDPCPSNLGA